MTRIRASIQDQQRKVWNFRMVVHDNGMHCSMANASDSKEAAMDGRWHATLLTTPLRQHHCES